MLNKKIFDKEESINNLYKSFLHNINEMSKHAHGFDKNFAVAISGGIDSVALTLLLDKYVKNLEYEVCLTLCYVDHGLRNESDKEIEYVENLAKLLGHKSKILYWQHDGIDSNIQARAREARYNLLTDFCNNSGINIVFTAHHLDDMIETFIMRSDRKASIFGLSTATTYYHNGVKILRPLHNIHKKDLEKYITSMNINWCEDISNHSTKYTRNYYRKQLKYSDEKFIDKIKNNIENINKQVIELNTELIQCFQNTIFIYEYGFALIDLNLHNKYSKDIKILSILQILAIIGGKKSIPRWSNAQKLFDQNYNIDSNIKGCTLHGCVIRIVNNIDSSHKLFIYREPKISKNTQINMSNKIIWDERFLLSHKKNLDNVNFNYSNFIVTNAYAKEIKSVCNKIENTKLYKQLKKNDIYSYKADILNSLPVVRYNKKIVAVPHINYYDNGVIDNGSLGVIFTPKFVSRFTHFL